MEPRIQYAKTSDGVSIAFCVMGGGPPLVHIAPAFHHLQLEWQIPKIRAWYERLAQRRKLIRFDWRGLGLSQREIPAPSPESQMLDLEAVIGSLGLDRFALLGPWHGGPTAITYAARNPERVSHLILWCAYARAADLAADTQLQATRALIDKDWDTYAETAAHLLFGWSEGDEARAFATLIRESTTPELLQVAIRALSEVDVTALLPQVQSPTLVLHRRGLRLGVDVATGLASRIPQARLAILEGTALMAYLEDMEAVATAIDEFLGEGEQAAAPSTGAPEAGGFRTVLFTDVEGSTALTQRLGDAGARELLREHERIVRECLKEHGGAEVKAMGDGFMASFGSATRALECAIAIQRAFDERNASLPAHPEALEARPERSRRGRAEPQPPAHASTGSARAGRDGGASPEPIRVRIGLNAGEPIAEEDPEGRGDLFGMAVNLAARIAAQANGGEILASDVVRQLVAGKGFLFADRGDVALRGFEDPVRLYEVRWRSEPVEGQA